MAFLFGRGGKPRGPVEVSRQTKTLLQRMLQTEDKVQIAQLDDDIARNVDEMRGMLAGTRDRTPTNHEQHRLVASLCEDDLFYLFAHAIPRISFERRKLVQHLLAATVRFRPETAPETDHPPVVVHLCQERPEALIQFCRGYERPDCAMQVGAILQEAFKFDSLVALVYYHEPGHDKRKLREVDPAAPASGNGIFWQFYKYIDRGSFESSANAFESFRALLTSHRNLASHYLRINAPLFFHRYHTLLFRSPSYVTKRQSIKLLADLLLDRHHYELMCGYVKDTENLKLAMTMLRDQRRMIAYEAFHIFKIFVADPEKSYGVLKILIMNKIRLAEFLNAFLAERCEEGQFNDEKAYCLSVIRELPDVVPENPGTELFTIRPSSYRRSMMVQATPAAV